MEKIIFILSLSAILFSAYAERPPQQMVQNLDNLAMANAGLILCEQTEEFKKMSANDALKIYDIDIHAEEIAAKYKDYYQNDTITIAFMRAEYAYAGMDSVRDKYIKKYGSLCSQQHINEEKNYVDDFDRAITSYFNENKKQ